MPYSFQDIKDSVTIITGAAQGIGRGIADLFSEHGAKVVILDIQKEAVESVAKEISDKGGHAIGKACDITNYEQVEQNIQEVMDEFGKIDHLINNAGITMDGLFIRMKPEQWQKVIDVNLTGVFNCSRAVVNHMRKVRKGNILNISSMSVVGNPGQANYASAKAGVIGLTATLGKELVSLGIRTNAIAPGFIKTEMTNKMPEKNINLLLKQIPMKRMGEPEEIAKVALFLCSNLASYVSCKTYFVDGGVV